MLRWLPENVSTYGADIDALLSLIYSLTLFWFVLTIGLIVVFLFRHRGRQGRRAAYVKGDRLAEAAWILVPAVIVLVLDLWIDHRGADAWAKVKGRIPPTDFRVQVTGKQYNWEIVYPGPDGKFGTADDLKLDNELHVPVNRVVHGTLKSKDVIHNFFLPNLRFKQDVLPGRDTPFWFQVTKPGKYPMPCAELCGFGHSGMNGWLYVHTPEDYDKWVKERWPSS
jgi:cytochrome c oxidase subunit 2